MNKISFAAALFLFLQVSPSAAAVKIGRMAMVMCHAPSLLLDSQGLLSKAGLKDFELKFFTQGGLSSKALAAKETDVAFFGAIIPAIANGLEARIVAINSMGGTQVVCHKDSKVESIGDLKGKTIGTVGPTAAPTSILTMALNHAGIAKSVDFRHFDRSKVVLAVIEKKEVECAAVLEPITSEMVSRGGRVAIDEKRLFNNGEYPFTFVVARRDFIESRRGEVRKILNAHAEALKLLNEKQDQVYPGLQKYFAENGMDVKGEEFKRAMATNIFKSSISRKVMNELIKVMADAEIIGKDKKFEDFVDCSFGMCVD